MNETQIPEAFISLRRAATRLGVPWAWLRGEAQAGRVPHLLVGRRLLFNPADLERVLIERTQASRDVGGDHA